MMPEISGRQALWICRNRSPFGDGTGSSEPPLSLLVRDRNRKIQEFSSEPQRTRASKPGGLGLLAGARAHRFLDQLDQPRAVDQLDRVVGRELVGGERECP